MPSNTTMLKCDLVNDRRQFQSSTVKSLCPLTLQKKFHYNQKTDIWPITITQTLYSFSCCCCLVVWGKMNGSAPLHISFRTMKIVLKWWDNFNFLVRILDSLPCLATIFYILQCLIMPCNNFANRTISQIQHVCDTQIWFTRFSHFDNILHCYIRQLLPLGHFHPNLQNNT